MKKSLLTYFTLIALLLGAGNASAQQKLIHYWHFNNINTGVSAAASPSTFTPIHANYSSLDSTKAKIYYVPSTTVSKNYKTYWDGVAGDTLNAKMGYRNQATGTNNALRVRNPSDSMMLLFYIPTKKYKNITIRFETEKSSFGAGASAPAKEVFDYSTDSGATWKTSGLSFPQDSFNNGNWNLVTLSLGADATTNNNNRLIFRIKHSIPNSGTSGNNRYDNFSVEGDSIAAPAQKLIHYWHFNNLNTGTSAAGSPSLIKPIHANWSSIDSTKALINYVPVKGVSKNYKTYWDNVGGDTLNARMAFKNQAAGTNNGLRVRNPSDSMMLLFSLPTTHYKNINIKYELELSSFGVSGSAPGRELFDYSIDSGTTWRTFGLSINQDSITNGGWNLMNISFGADPGVNNNPKFMFRIKTTPPNAITSGNHRYDNFTVEGDSLGKKPSSVQTIANPALICNLYPNPSSDNVTIATGSELNKSVVVYNINGQIVFNGESKNTDMRLDVSSLSSGMYFVHIVEIATGKSANIKLMKN